jgi:hypothetical protein
MGANSFSFRVAVKVGPIVSSNFAAKKPPWILPKGFVNSLLHSRLPYKANNLNMCLLPADTTTVKIYMV